MAESAGPNEQLDVGSSLDTDSGCGFVLLFFLTAILSAGAAIVFIFS